MSGKRLRDLIVLLPGIMGSALQKDGRDLWATSGQAAWSAISSFGATLEHLTVQAGAPDGISATGLLQDAHIIPGLVKIDGYSAISRMIVEHFNIQPPTSTNNFATNFIEFPYDWRLDNRESARRLDKMVKERLHSWRAFTGNKDARVIFIAHSMGGLVARYFLEVLDGWRDCRALITFGTPYRGSPNALNYLSNGYKKLFLDLTATLRSFPSVHQLLPIYECLRIGEQYVRIEDAGELPGIKRELAADALKFHREIEAKVNEHRSSAEYFTNGYAIMPVVGSLQPTLQSAVFDGSAVISSVMMPPVVDDGLVGGDGTVPRISAIPIELSNADRATFVAECHGSLQCNLFVLNDIRGRLEQMQATNTGNVRLPGQKGGESPLDRQDDERPSTARGFSLSIEDLYSKDEPVVIRASVVNADDSEDPPVAIVQQIGKATDQRVVHFRAERENDQWSFHLLGLENGTYRVQIRPERDDPFAPPPVQDIFMIEQ